jgi:hypothetical protein
MTVELATNLDPVYCDRLYRTTIQPKRVDIRPVGRIVSDRTIA